ncbi:MAG: hypothetical protein ABI458_02780 [Chloroflexota bacterium]
MDPAIKRYLDEHGATYTRDALRRSLVDAGHDPAAVDVALAEWEAQRTGTNVGPEKRRTFGRWAMGLHVAALVAVFLLLVVLKGTAAIGLAVLGCAVLAVAMLIGWAISSLVGRALLPRAGVIVALVVPAISALALSGTCFALLSSSIGTPPRNGTVDLEVLAPRAFNGSGAASCYVATGSVLVDSQRPIGTLDGKTVSVSVTWYGDDPNNPVPASSTSISVFFEPTAAEKLPESFGVIFSTNLEVEVAPEGLTGTIQFDGLASEPIGAPGEPSTPEVISGSVTWSCK